MRVKYFTTELEVIDRGEIIFHETRKLKYIHVLVLKVLSSIQSLRALLICVSPNSAPSLPPSLSLILTFCPVSGMEVKTSNSSRDKPVTYLWAEKVECQAIEKTQTASKHSSSKHW